MSDETITVRRDGGNGNDETVTVRRGNAPVGGETVTVNRGGQASASGETVTVRRADAPASGETVTVRRDDAPSTNETVTVRRPATETNGETVTVARPSVGASADGKTVTVSRPGTPATGETVTVPRAASPDGQTVTVSRGAATRPNGETVTISRGGAGAAATSFSPFVAEDVTVVSNDGQQFIVHLGQVIGHGGQASIVAAERVSDGLACVAKVFKPLVGAERSAYQKVVSAVMGLNGRPVSQTHLLPIFAYLHQGLSATEVGTAAPLLWDVSITPLATCLFDRPRSKNMVKSRVIPELSQAIELLHTELGIVHRDIKPQNVYLYEKQIVLGDYGSARSLKGFDSRKTYTETRSDGYTPGRGGMVDPRNDWYSFGYTIWTLYENNVHPLQEFMVKNDKGEFDLSDRLETGEPADFSHPDDATLGNLLKGLTFELSGERFGYEEVKDWMADPDHFYRKLPTMDAGSARKPYEFAGKQYSDPVLLARALSSNWDEAKLRMSQQQLENLMGDWGENDLQTRIHQLVEEDIQTASNPDLALACVIYEMSNGKIMSWRGEDVSLTNAPDALPARIASMAVDTIDRYAQQSGLDGTNSSGVLPSGFLSLVLSREANADSQRVRLGSDIHSLELLARQSDDPHFAACLFKGLLTSGENKHAMAQGALKSVLRQPSAFFGVCSSSRSLDEFLLYFAGDVDMSAIIAARDGANAEGGIDTDVVLVFMDKVADDKAAVRSFYRKYGNYAAWIWLSGHTDLYETMQGSTGEAAVIALRGLNPAMDAPVSTLVKLGSNARLEGIKLRGDMESTPVPYILGWELDERFGTRPIAMRSLFCAQVKDDVVPRGYVSDLLTSCEDHGVLDILEIRLLADVESLPSAAYSQYLDDARGVADGKLKAAIETDTREYGVVKGIADSDAQIAAVKKEQRNVLITTIAVALLYLLIIKCARGAFGQLIVSLGTFGPLVVVFLVLAFLGSFGFLALNVLRSFSAVDRVSGLEDALDSNAAALEGYLVKLVDFDGRNDKITEILSVQSGDAALTDARKPLFSTGRHSASFYTDPEVMDRFGRLAGRLVLITALIVSAFGFMGSMYVDGDVYARVEVLIAVCFGLMIVLIVFGEDAHPGSAQALRSWLYMWIPPILIEFLLSGVVSFANFLSLFGFIFLLLAFVISAIAFVFFRGLEKWDDLQSRKKQSPIVQPIAAQQNTAKQDNIPQNGVQNSSTGMKTNYKAPVSHVYASGSAASVGRTGNASAAKKETANTKKSSSGVKGKKEPNASGYGVYDGMPCRIDIYANYIKIIHTSMYSGRRDLDKYKSVVKSGKTSDLDKAFNRPYAVNTINIPANALTNWLRMPGITNSPEFTFDRKDRELHTRVQHTIQVFSSGFDEVLEDFADSHFHY